MVDRERLQAGLKHTLDSAAPALIGAPASWRYYEGKVRDNYSLPNGTRLLVTTDRISAFDRVLTTLPLKGQVLNQVSAWWFERTRDIAPNHLVRVIDPQAIVARECTPLPVEMVVRAYLTGVTSTSIWTAYARGERTFAGHAIPDGLRKNDPLPAPILTPSTKAPKGGHDISVSRAELLAEGRIEPHVFDRAGELALALFKRGQALCAERGLILADTKYELGLAPDGEIVVIDEIHTPDSSRFWFASSYAERVAAGAEPESFDKEFVRRWLAGQGFTGDGPIPAIPDDIRVEASARYIAAYEAITGTTFTPDFGEPLARLRAAVEALVSGAA
ncbi:MAG: phosphoribosylaminoimidazolesuccinocarboxamide synthase [Polyangiaceae bacterium]